MTYRLPAFALALALATAAYGEDAPFAPFTIDAQRFQQIDEAVGKLAMPRDAHIAWQQLWVGLERQAQEQAKKSAEPAK